MNPASKEAHEERKKLKNIELKELSKKLGLPITGNKPDLLTNIKKHYRKQEKLALKNSEGTNTATDETKNDKPLFFEAKISKNKTSFNKTSFNKTKDSSTEETKSKISKVKARENKQDPVQKMMDNFKNLLKN